MKHCADLQRNRSTGIFGIPVLAAAVSSLFAVRALFTGILSSRTRGTAGEMLVISAAMILVLCVIECIYMTAVKRSSSRLSADAYGAGAGRITD